MPVSDAQRKAHEKYFADKWSQVKLAMPNEEAAALRQYCADHGLTVAGFIRELVRNAIAAAADPVQRTPEGCCGDAVPSVVTASHSRE